MRERIILFTLNDNFTKQNKGAGERNVLPGVLFVPNSKESFPSGFRLRAGHETMLRSFYDVTVINLAA
jgi:hypothetical protein